MRPALRLEFGAWIDLFEQLNTGDDGGHYAQEINIRTKQKGKEYERHHQMQQSVMDEALNSWPGKVPIGRAHV